MKRMSSQAHPRPPCVCLEDADREGIGTGQENYFAAAIPAL